MSDLEGKTFGGIEALHANFENSAILLQSIPYDGTSTWGKGANNGFAAFLDAAENMELYDIETHSEVYKRGIHIVDPVLEDTTPEAVFQAVYSSTKQLLSTNKFLTFFGGEHSISIGIIKAFYEKYPDLTVVQIDAHADLRPSYLGSPYNHACAVYDASHNCSLWQIGIRSMDSSERPFFKREQCILAEEMDKGNEWMDEVVTKISGPVYITLDLDAFDPSIMPATGTPEPGGMYWYPMITFLKKLISRTRCLGFDIVELAPIVGLKFPEFLVAKLYYKMLSYQFEL